MTVRWKFTIQHSYDPKQTAGSDFKPDVHTLSIQSYLAWAIFQRRMGNIFSL